MSKIDPKNRKVEIIPGCIICKTCEFLAPEIFSVPEKGLSSVVLQQNISEEQLPNLLEAIKRCPERVIKFREKKSK